MPDPIESLDVENVVGSTGLKRELDLERVAMDLKSADYDPDNFPGLVYRMQDPKSTALLFRSGKIVCTGANSVDGLHEAMDIVYERLQKLGISIGDEPNIVIQNIVMSADIGNRLNLNAVAIGLGLEQVEYEPEQFPGLIYRLEKSDVVALLFGSGKVVITGGKALEDGREGVKTIITRLDELDLLGNG